MLRKIIPTVFSLLLITTLSYSYFITLTLKKVKQEAALLENAIEVHKVSFQILQENIRKTEHALSEREKTIKTINAKKEENREILKGKLTQNEETSSWGNVLLPHSLHSLLEQ